ncbi:conjugal transfer protein TraL [Xanthomonas perforans]|uniref:nucleotide-binding protein n=1 Tax=Xanthomonas perforans TaxID=442694 RepID=UPI0031C02745|nr:conjugal transfer protein TraL [Xanthomonas perforans]
MTPSPQKNSTTSFKGQNEMNAIAKPAQSKERVVHFILQGKGGVGKSFIASCIAQYLQDQGRPFRAYDTDPVNATLSGYEAFPVERIELMDGGTVNTRHFDQMIESILTDEKDFVLDNGASSFIPLSFYMVENGVIEMLVESGIKVVVHTVITGGQALADTLTGLQSLAQQLPQGAEIVVWLNEFFGQIVAKNKAFEEMKVYQENRGRISGIVTIRKQTGETFGEDVKMMLDRRLTFGEVAQSEQFGLMAKQRLASVKRALWSQLDLVI